MTNNVMYVAQLILQHVDHKVIIHRTVNQSLDRNHAKKELIEEARMYRKVTTASKPTYKVLKKLIIEVPIGKVKYFK